MKTHHHLDARHEVPSRTRSHTARILCWIALGLLALTGWITPATEAATYRYTFTWTNTDENVDANMIDRSLDGVNFTPLATVAPDPASYEDNGLVCGTAYYYRVSSHSSEGYSDYSNVQAVNTPPMVSITNLSDYQTVTNGVITGTAKGANGLQSVTVNGQSAVINGTNWTATLALVVGTNTLVVVATDNSSDHNTVTTTVHVIVLPPPVADFDADVTTGAAPLPVNFTDLSTGTITTRAWTFGDGATSTAANPSHTYAAAGTYAVKLTVTGPTGSGQLNRSGYITVTNVVVDLTAPTLAIASPVNNLLVSSAALTVSGTASDVSGIQSVTVNGQAASITGSSWTRAVTLALGTNTLTVVATDNSSNHNTKSQTIQVIYYPVPVANFTGTPTAGTAPLVVDFTETSTGPVSTRRWTFGDNSTATTANPSHTYVSAGTYSVKLTVTGPGGQGELTRTAYIVVTNVVVDLTAPTLTVAAPANNQLFSSPSITVSGTATDAGGIQKVTVNGQTATLNGSNWSMGVTLTLGTNTLTIIATDNSSNHNTKTQTVQVVYFTAPVADFSADVMAGPNPLLVNFTDASTGAITSRAWTFGDGASSTLVNPSHMYAAAGTYSVKLTVTGLGGSNQLTRTGYITVTNVVNDTTAPSLTVASPANFQQFSSANVTVTGSASDAGGIQKVTVNGQTASLNGTSWSLGIVLVEGTNTLVIVATDNSANHNVTTQTVRAVLKSSSSNGPTQLQILDGPVVSNSMAQVADTAVIMAGNAVGFRVTAKDNRNSSLTYAWDFGDGQTGTGFAPTHTYTNSTCDAYHVRVIVNNGVESVTGTVVAATACQLNVTRLQMNANFTKQNADRINLTATVDAGVGFNPTGQTLSMDLGQAQVSFVLDKAGKGTNPYGTCRLALNKKTGFWTLTASLKNGDWHALWATYDMVKGPLSVSAVTVSVPAIVVIGHDAFAAQPQMLYSAATEKSGSAR